jgi:pyrimidine deaminase RibD-like protein
MLLALAKARKHYRGVSHNPPVGALIIKNNKIIGLGAHEKFGGAHAEINALKDAERRQESVEGATIYITLEPCNHRGKTGPCTEAIINSKINKVIIAEEDNKNGGLQYLNTHGIETQILPNEEAKNLIKPWKIFNSCGMPSIDIAVHLGLNGKIIEHDSYLDNKIQSLLQKNTQELISDIESINSDKNYHFGYYLKNSKDLSLLNNLLKDKKAYLANLYILRSLNFPQNGPNLTLSPELYDNVLSLKKLSKFKNYILEQYINNKPCLLES